MATIPAVPAHNESVACAELRAAQARAWARYDAVRREALRVYNETVDPVQRDYVDLLEALERAIAAERPVVVLD